MAESTTGTRPALTELSDDEIAFRDAVVSFAASEVKPRVDEMERAGRIDPALVRQYFEMGLMGIEVPEEYGGAAGSLMMVALAVEEVSKVDPAAAIMNPASAALFSARTTSICAISAAVGTFASHAASTSSAPSPLRSAPYARAWRFRGAFIARILRSRCDGPSASASAPIRMPP